MFISSAMSAVVTCGSPSRLNSVNAVSRMRSRVRRGGFEAMDAIREVTRTALLRVRNLTAKRTALDKVGLGARASSTRTTIKVVGQSSRRRPHHGELPFQMHQRMLEVARRAADATAACLARMQRARVVQRRGDVSLGVEEPILAQAEAMSGKTRRNRVALPA